MTFVVAWLVFPSLLGALVLGAGLFVEWLGGHRLPGPALAGVGFTALVCSSQVLTLAGISAVLAPLGAVVLAVAGFVLGRARVRAAGIDATVVGVALGAYLVFAAPGLLTGSATFLGYTNLGDAAIHFELVDRWMAHGPSLDGLVPSSYSESLRSYFDTSYPTGSHTVLGTVRELLGTDVAWLFQPYLAVLATIAALGLQALAQPGLRSRRLAALVAFAAIQASLVFSYASHEQALKELATVVCVVTAATLVGPVVRTPPTWRSGLPLAIASAGSLGVLSVALVPWIGPLLLVALVGVGWRRGRADGRGFALQIAGFAVLGGLLAVPALSRLGNFVSVTKGVLASVVELGNLPHPLEFVQAFGAWPTEDFRVALAPGMGGATVIVGAFALAAVLGLIQVVRHSSGNVLLFSAVSLVAFLALAGRTSPWAYGKALMILSPAVLLLSVMGAALLWEHNRRPEAGLIGVVLLIGVVWTNAQTYHNVDAAPHERFAELEHIDDRFGGQGPAVYFEDEEFAKHFLRDTDPTGAVDPRKPDWLRNVRNPPRYGFSSDVDDWSATALADRYRLIVTRRGPGTSRPPSDYARVFNGTYYDVWRRDDDAPRVLEHEPLGGNRDEGGLARCTRVHALADRAEAAGGQLVSVARPPLSAAHLTEAPAPRGWVVDPGDDETWQPRGQGLVTAPIRTAAGTYDVWLEASVGRSATVSVDDQTVGELANALNPRLSATRIGRVQLAEGRHTVSLFVGGGSLDPRNGGSKRLIGPVTLVPADAAETPQPTDPRDWRSLCGRRLDWVEAVA